MILTWLEGSAVGICYLILSSHQHNEVGILTLLERCRSQGLGICLRSPKLLRGEDMPFVFAPCHFPRNKWASAAIFPKTWNSGTLEPHIDLWEKICGPISLKKWCISLHSKIPRVQQHIDGSDKSCRIEPNETLNHCCFPNLYDQRTISHVWLTRRPLPLLPFLPDMVPLAGKSNYLPGSLR